MEKMSIFKSLKTHSPIFLFFLVLLASLGLGYYFFFYEKKVEYSEISPKAVVLEKLQHNPEYLQTENLEVIQGLSTMEYLRTRMLYHSRSSSNPENAALEELERDFPGERGRVLMNLLLAQNLWEKEKREIEKDENLDEYQKYLRGFQKRKEIFGENLEPILFAPKESEKIETFFLYSQRYLRKHETDTPRSKKAHLEKARMEIYGENYDSLLAKEPFEKRLELELRIYEREMSIFTEEERIQKIAKIKKELLWR
jgi:hypothetical protein